MVDTTSQALGYLSRYGDTRIKAGTSYSTNVGGGKNKRKPESILAEALRITVVQQQ